MGFVFVLIFRKKHPERIKYTNILVLLYAAAAAAFITFLYYFMYSVLDVKQTDFIMLSFFFLIFFTRFELKTTFLLLTGYYIIFLTFILLTGCSPVGISVSYILSMLGAVAMWLARVQSFVNEKNFSALITSDFLTGVLNRRGFDIMLEKIWGEARQRGEKVTLYMIDIDHFKRYNDLYGHLEGDKCLKAVAQAIAAAMRRGDCVARYGGEEFAVLIAKAKREDEIRIGRRIFEHVAAAAIPHRDSVTPYVTISIGCADYTPSEGEGLTAALVKMADDALYRAKEGGRNRIVFYDEKE